MMGWLKDAIGGRTFAHGVHPPECKDATSGLPIRQFPFAPLLIVPLTQHIGKPAVPIVQPEQEVVRGQCIAEPDGRMSVAIHAPATGLVRRIAPSPAISGKMETAVFLEPYPGSTQEQAGSYPACRLEEATPPQVIYAIQQAGIVGLGGAGFPTHQKLTLPAGKRVDTLVVNGAECEPYLTTDHRVMLEQAPQVMRGIEYARRATLAERVVIAVEENKQDAAEALQQAIPQHAPISIRLLPVKYPQGAEKMLIESVLQRRIPAGGLPVDVAAVCINVGTLAEIGDLLPLGRGLVERVVTVSGDGIRTPGNYLVPIGTPLRFILETLGAAEEIASVVLGGPMMGSAASSLDIPVTKGTTGVIALQSPEMRSLGTRREYPCIHCGACLDACPLFLNPSQLGLLAKQDRYPEMAEAFHLMDCFECGCCSFVCPAHIPLVQRFRVAKAVVRKTRALQ